MHELDLEAVRSPCSTRSRLGRARSKALMPLTSAGKASQQFGLLTPCQSRNALFAKR